MAKDNKKKDKKDQPKKQSFKDVGRVLTRSEVSSLAKAKKTDPLTIMSKALEKGIGLGSKVVDAYNTPGGLGNYRYQGTPSNITPLKDLSIGKGNVYYGSTTSTTPSTRGRNTGYTPGSTTYSPIVAPRSLGSGRGRTAADTTVAETPGPEGKFYTQEEIDSLIEAAGQTAGQNLFDEYLNQFGLSNQKPFDPYAGMSEVFAAAMAPYQQSIQSSMDLMSQFAMPQYQEPMRSYGAGFYNTEAIRAAQRDQKRRTGYLRSMGISGGTSGAPALSSGMSIGSALTTPGGVSI
jgi:hypothetical protein